MASMLRSFLLVAILLCNIRKSAAKPLKSRMKGGADVDGFHESGNEFSAVRNQEPLSPIARHIFVGANVHDFLDRTLHIEQSRRRFDELSKKIDHSTLITLEDGEPDDVWQLLLGAFRQQAPTMILLRGGYWKIRQEVYKKIWGYLSEKFNIQAPKIMTIHGATEEQALADFDQVEGLDIFSKQEIERLREASDHNQEYRNQVADAKKELLKVLNKNKFTTIALKTAPSGLVDVITQVKRYKEKIGIVWTGPVTEREDGGLLGDFNFYQDRQAGQKLLKLSLPTIMVSPLLGYAQMASIVDKKVMPSFRKYSKTANDFPGFDRLSELNSNGQLVISTALAAPAELFQQRMIKLADAAEPLLKKREQELRDERVNLTGRQTKEVETRLAEIKKELEALRDEYSTKVVLGRRWSNIRLEEPTFKEFCPVDQYVEPIINPALREESVDEVIEVSLKRDINQGDTVLIATPKEGGNVFIIGKWNSEPLAAKIQSSINWMADGEPKEKS